MGDRRAGRTSQARERGRPAASEELGVEHSVEEKSLELGLGGPCAPRWRAAISSWE